MSKYIIYELGNECQSKKTTSKNTRSTKKFGFYGFLRERGGFTNPSGEMQCKPYFSSLGSSEKKKSK
jgi:hypothetical protein